MGSERVGIGIEEFETTTQHGESHPMLGIGFGLGIVPIVGRKIVVGGESKPIVALLETDADGIGFAGRAAMLEAVFDQRNEQQRSYEQNLKSSRFFLRI